MKTEPVKAAVLGYGVIGRRLADAVHAQEDMELIGIACRPTSLSIRDAAMRGFPIYLTAEAEAGHPAKRFGRICGRFDELLDRTDVLLDCTPKGTPPLYREHYDRRENLVVIVQGGESHEFGGFSFNAFANYAAAPGQKRIRVISCSSTGSTRILYPLHRCFGVEDAHVMLVRRSNDPAKRCRIPVNALKVEMGFSHHAHDVQTVLPDLNMTSVATMAPTTRSHILTARATLSRDATADEVADALDGFPRIIVGTGLRTTADIAEHFTDRGRRRHDVPEIYVWREGLRVENRIVTASVNVHMESITIPETVDCIRSVFGMEPNGWASIRKTDRAMGIEKEATCYDH